MAASAGKVALVSTNSALTGACPAAADIVDLVGYGPSANCFRGTGPTVAPGNTTAVMRRSNGCNNSDNNSADFVAATPSPRNAAAMLNPCATTQLSSAEIWPELANTLLAYDLCFVDVGCWRKALNLGNHKQRMIN
jgi:hypothetical protein